MAINIFSGGGNTKSTAPRVSSAATRAAETTSAVNGPAVASDSGSTAVKSTGILGKIGGFINKVAGFAKNVPGIVGNIAGVVEKLTSANDPEWWNTIPGDGLTVNAALMGLSYGGNFYAQRPAFLNFVSASATTVASEVTVINVSDRMSTQYLMPAVRKVVNAVQMKSAHDYATVFKAQATLYAIWCQLIKYRTFMQKGRTFIPDMGDGAFPLFQTTNAAWLQSTITRLEEYLSANVRLPHTLCEYLAWRYGKAFRMNNSAKAGFVFYDVLPMIADPSGDLTIDGLSTVKSFDAVIQALMGVPSGTPDLQQASADLYNAYLSHDQMVNHDSTLFDVYDAKEFCLRTNLDLDDFGQSIYGGIDKNSIIIDSNLDNQTVFMASTVSCRFGDNGVEPLFPVYLALVYGVLKDPDYNSYAFVAPMTTANAESFVTDDHRSCIYWSGLTGGKWYFTTIRPYILDGLAVNHKLELTVLLQSTVIAKACDYYNVGLYLAYAPYNASSGGVGPSQDHKYLVDMTAISMDTGLVPDTIIENEQVIAFANLVTEVHKDATTYKAIEKRVAKDVANFVEANEIATIAK